MCIVAWNWQPGTSTPLLLLSNRDEYYARPTTPLHWWDGAGSTANILAGQDLQAGGTWLGITRTGRLAAITNYRSVEPILATSPSRGELVAKFLQDDMDAATYLQQLACVAKDYNPFNLLVFDGTQLLGLQSRDGKVVEPCVGIGAVSNADFQTPWPKLTRLTHGLQKSILANATAIPQMLALLHDASVPSDEQLPQTGIPKEFERALSAIFVTTPGYGTRACSVVRIGQQHVEFTEQSMNATGAIGLVDQSFARECSAQN